MQNNPAIVSAVEIPPGRYPDDTVHDLYRRVLRKLLAESHMDPHGIDGLLVPPPGSAGPTTHAFLQENLSEEIGIRPNLSVMLSAGGATFGYMVQYAALAIGAGMAEAVVCVGAGKFEKMSPSSAAAYARAACHEEFEFLYGPVIPALYAQYACRYMYDTGTSSEDLAAVSVAAREWAAGNSHALTYNRPSITVQDVLESRMIASPLHYLDCSVPCDGGGAVLVTSGRLAGQLTSQPAFVLGVGEGHGRGYVSQSTGTRPGGTAASGHAAFRMSGLTPQDIDQVQLYDAFSFTPLLLLDDLGFTGPGEAAAWYHEGRTSPGGDFPVNTFGGLIGYGHTGEAAGMSPIVECARQVMGSDPSRRQRSGTALVHTYGGMMADHSTLILGQNP